VGGGARDSLRLLYAREPDGVTVELLQAPKQVDGKAALWKNSLNL
jgi:hypothetical protein